MSLISALMLAIGLVSPRGARGEDKNEFGLWGGASVSDPHLIGTTGDRQLSLFALRYGRLLLDSDAASLEYTVDVLPVEVLRQPAYAACPPGQEGFCPSGRETAYGGGADPIGLKVNIFRRHRLQLFGASTAGFVVSQKRIPMDIPGGTQFNFTFDFQAGLQFFDDSRTQAWTLGYKFQHISNANTSSLNPGVDANVLFLGYSFFR
jgi:hypothetical protein